MRILILSRYDWNGASSRLRTLQYISSFQNIGVSVTVSPLYDERTLEALYRHRRRSFANLSKSYFRRFSSLLAAHDYDVVWVEKEIFPYLPSFFENFIIRAKIPYVLDYDDAIFHNYDMHQSKLVRFFLSKKLDSLIRNSSAVTVGNSYLGAYASDRGAKKVVFLPTVVDTDRYECLDEPPDNVFRVGWIGTPFTASYLDLIQKPLRRLADETNLLLVTIGAPELTNFGIPVEQHQWSLETECKILSTFHVGIMPLSDSPWEKGKCGYKLIQYMACGRPVVASRIGVNNEIVKSDVGLLASCDEEWFAALQKLHQDRKLRVLLGRAGRVRVEKKYSTQVVFPRLQRLLEMVSHG